MLLARVAGQVWGSKQAESLVGKRLLVVQPLTAQVQSETELPGASVKWSALATQSLAVQSLTVQSLTVQSLAVQSLAVQSLAVQSRAIVAVDELGAGPGELVLVAHGSRCRDLTLGESVATKEVIVAIVDDAQVFLPCLGQGVGT